MMTEEKLKELNELKEEIRNCETNLNEIGKYVKFNGRNIELGGTSYFSTVVPVPDELRGVILTLMKDYYSRKLNDLKNKFAEA